MEITRPLAELTDYFRRFPGIGPKSAQRMAFYLLKMQFSDVEKFAQKMIEAKSTIKSCSKCFNMSANDPCEICSDNTRNEKIICVVAETKDLIAIEKTREYKGMYHVLQGLLSPIDGIGANDIRIKELLNRITENDTQEVILALNPSVEGEATTLYIAKLLKPFGIKISRIALGIPVGSDLEYSDEITLAKALEGRREI